MTVKLLFKQYLEFLSLMGGCSGSSVSIHVKMPLCWKSHVTADTCTTVSEMDPLKLYVSGITSKESEEKLQKMFPKARNIECIKDKKGVYKM